MSRTGDPRYRRRRARLLAADDLVCAFCNLPIDKTIKWPHPMSPSADHIDPIAAGGHNLGPLQPAHYGCNSTAGAKGAYHAPKKRRHVRPW